MQRLSHGSRRFRMVKMVFKFKSELSESVSIGQMQRSFGHTPIQRLMPHDPMAL